MTIERLALAVLLIATTSCASEPDTVVGTPPPREDVKVRKPVGRIQMPTDGKMKREKNEPEPMLSISGWPFQETGNNFRLFWKGAQNATILYAEPSLNAVKIGEVSWEDGEEVIVRGSAVAVFQPSIYRAQEANRIEGYVYDTESYRTGGAAVSYDINPGETIEVYHYKSDGICYMGVRSRVVEANCPTKGSWNGNFRGKVAAEQLAPASRIWWIQITTPQASGWLQVDDRFAVDIESI
jgi:hypothetical protein